MFKTTLLPHLDTVEELWNAGLLWEEGLPPLREHYLAPIKCKYSECNTDDDETVRRLRGTAVNYRIGLLLEE